MLIHQIFVHGIHNLIPFRAEMCKRRGWTGILISCFPRCIRIKCSVSEKSTDTIRFTIALTTRTPLQYHSNASSAWKFLDRELVSLMKIQCGCGSPIILPSICRRCDALIIILFLCQVDQAKSSVIVRSRNEKWPRPRRMIYHNRLIIL